MSRHKRFPGKEDLRASRKKVTGRQITVKTYVLWVDLECGHRTRTTISGRAYAAGDRGPEVMECYACAEAMANTPERDAAAAEADKKDRAIANAVVDHNNELLKKPYRHPDTRKAGDS